MRHCYQSLKIFSFLQLKDEFLKRQCVEKTQSLSATFISTNIPREDRKLAYAVLTEPDSIYIIIGFETVFSLPPSS